MAWQVLPAVLHAVHPAVVFGSAQVAEPPLLEPEPDELEPPEPEPDELYPPEPDPEEL